jgi:hypothetical protein
VTDPLVTGTVSGTPGADVLLFGPGDRPVLLAAGLTDAAGAFALEPSANDLPDTATLLVKLKGDPVGVLARAVKLPRPVHVELVPSVAFALRIGIESDSGSPDELVLALEPIRPEGVPERLWPFINQRGPGVFDGRFLTRTISEPESSVRLLPGIWTVGAEFLDHNRPNMTEPDFHNYVTTSARSEPDGAPLAGSEHGGYEIEVGDDRRVTLTLREVDDEEL